MVSKKRIIYIALSIIIASIISLLPPTNGLTAESMRFAGIFVAVLILLVSQAVPDWAVGLAGCAMIVLTKTGTVAESFSAFSGSTVWLLIMIFAFSAGIGNSGILKRISLKFLSIFPASYNGAVAALMSCGVVLGPMIPSTVAKANLVLPVANEITDQLGLKERSKGATGLFAGTLITTYILGNAFITGGGGVPILIGFSNTEFDFVKWFLACSVWFLVVLFGTYIYVVKFCKPAEELNLTPMFFKERSKNLPPITTKEKIALALLFSAIVLWATTSLHKLDTGMIGLMIVFLMTITGILETKDFTTKIPWSLIIFIGCVLGMSTFMSTLGWSDLFIRLVGPIMQLLVSNPWIFVPFLCVFVYLIRFVLVDQTTLIILMVTIFGPFMENAGMSLFILMFVQYMSGFTWNTNYQNPSVLGLIAVSNKVVYKDAQKVSYVYMLLNLLGFVLSIPVWRILGYIW